MAVCKKQRPGQAGMKTYGLIGFPLTHSFSKKYFEEKFRQEGIEDHGYHLYPLPFIESFLPFLGANPGLQGLNVTIPYKEAVMEFLDEIDPSAKAIGAVNCIEVAGGHLKGYNTDAPAFEQSIQGFLTERPQQAFVLGTGGSARAVCYVLGNMGIDYLLVSRQPGDDKRIGYNEVAKHMKESNLFVNTTPQGMFPDVESFPDLPYFKLTEKDFLFDLVYNPEETIFLKRGKEKGAHVKNGIEMLRLQAEGSWKIWNKQE
jgi:shikimate dehydrogenase